MAVSLVSCQSLSVHKHEGFCFHPSFLSFQINLWRKVNFVLFSPFKSSTCSSKKHQKMERKMVLSVTSLWYKDNHGSILMYFLRICVFFFRCYWGVYTHAHRYSTWSRAFCILLHTCRSLCHHSWTGCHANNPRMMAISLGRKSFSISYSVLWSNMHNVRPAV